MKSKIQLFPNWTHHLIDFSIEYFPPFIDYINYHLATGVLRSHEATLLSPNFHNKLVSQTPKFFLCRIRGTISHFQPAVLQTFLPLAMVSYSNLVLPTTS